MFEIYRKRPILAWSATAIGALFVVWLLWPRRSAANQSVVAYDAGPTAEETAMGYQFQAAQLQAQTTARAQDTAAQIRYAELQTGYRIAELNAQLEDRTSERMWSLQDLSLNISRDLGLEQSAANERMYNIGLAAQDAADERNATLQAYSIESQNQLIQFFTRSNMASQLTANWDTPNESQLDAVGRLISGTPVINPFTIRPPGTI